MNGFSAAFQQRNKQLSLAQQTIEQRAAALRGCTLSNRESSLFTSLQVSKKKKKKKHMDSYCIKYLHKEMQHEKETEDKLQPTRPNIHELMLMHRDFF